MTALGTGESYAYDANGNMTTRVEGGLTYTQTFDAENRLISVAVSGQTTQFIYDGDGNLVKKINPDGSKTLYIAGIYEVDKTSGGAVTGTRTYYPAAGAMRIGSTLYYVLKDHLGSASVVTNSSGTMVGEQRYYPFGETRFTSGTMYTDKLFTGQRAIAGLGIYNYGARFYSPYINRFLSADTIVPGYANPQNLNRYSYVTNNPLRYTDPTGHKPCEEYAGTCLSENQVTQIWNNTQNGNHHDDDDEPVVTLTLTRDDLDGIQDLANQLSTQYAAQGQAWAWGVGTAATLGMLAVDGLSCGAAFGTAGVLTGGCVAALALNGVVIPSAANLAGAFGGNAAAQDFNDLSDVMNETLADNPQLTEFTVTIDLITETEILLPGGVGPTYTNYTVQITGMNSPVVLSGYAGGDVISMLFGVSP